MSQGVCAGVYNVVHGCLAAIYKGLFLLTDMLDKLVEKFDFLGAVFVDNENKEEMKIITELEKSLDRIVEEELIVVQIDDPDYSEQLGLKDPPTLVQFSGDIPNLYSGPENVKSMIKWLVRYNNLTFLNPKASMLY